MGRVDGSGQRAPPRTRGREDRVVRQQQPTPPATEPGADKETIMGLLWDLFGPADVETHGDGSTTERFSDGTSVTRDSDGSAREYTRHETTGPLGLGDKITTTYDGDGGVVNVQGGWGSKA